MSADLLVEPGLEGGGIIEILDGQTDDVDPAAPPLEIAVAVVGEASLSAMVRSVDLDHEGLPASHDERMSGLQVWPARSGVDTRRSPTNGCAVRCA
ncbi:hypothetical protein FAIPA1_230029 [Frankia sp. AiPs1]